MRQIIDLVPVHPRLVDDPRRVREDLIRPPTVTDGLAPFRVGHGGGGFVVCAELVRTHTDEEVHAGEGEFGLAQLESVAEG